VLEETILQILSGKNLQFDEAFELAATADPMEFYRAADELRKKLHNNSLDVCSISMPNPESAATIVNVARVPPTLMSKSSPMMSSIDQLAKENEQYGVQRFFPRPAVKFSKST
jgi:biotin synthase